MYVAQGYYNDLWALIQNQPRFPYRHFWQNKKLLKTENSFEYSESVLQGGSQAYVSNSLTEGKERVWQSSGGQNTKFFTFSPKAPSHSGLARGG